MEIKRKKESESDRKKRRSRFKMRELSYMTSELRVILKFKKLPTTGLKEDLIR